MTHPLLAIVTSKEAGEAKCVVMIDRNHRCNAHATEVLQTEKRNHPICADCKKKYYS